MEEGDFTYSGETTVLEKIFMKIFHFYWAVTHFKENEQDIKRKIIFWFFLRHHKYKIYMKWISVGTGRRFAYDKARNNVPYFEKQINKDRWLRKQKLKRILK